MDCAKIGRLIARLRKEKGLTQQDIADALGITNKTVSKWECGLGCPDVGLWPELSVILGAEVTQLMEGGITPNKPDSGNIERVHFYVCPTCHNVLVSTGSASIHCCGRKLEPLKVIEEQESPKIEVETVDVDYYITIGHEMTREHHLLFAAYIKSDRVFLTRLYPEQEAAVRVPNLGGGKLYLYCTRHGLALYRLRRGAKA